MCENTEGHDAVSKPRNVKQIHNLKATQQQGARLTRDAIYNAHELAYEGNFVAYGRDPSTQSYVPRMMRQHLIGCLENRSIKPFFQLQQENGGNQQDIADLDYFGHMLK